MLSTKINCVFRSHSITHSSSTLLPTSLTTLPPQMPILEVVWYYRAGFCGGVGGIRGLAGDETVPGGLSDNGLPPADIVMPDDT